MSTIRHRFRQSRHAVGALVLAASLLPCAHAQEGRTNDSGSIPVRLKVDNIMGGSTQNIDTQNFVGGNVTTIMGGVVIDLTHADMPGDTVIHLFAVMGGIKLRVPPGWTVVDDLSTVLGGVNDSSIHPLKPMHRLTLRGSTVLGGVTISN